MNKIYRGWKIGLLAVAVFSFALATGKVYAENKALHQHEQSAEKNTGAHSKLEEHEHEHEHEPRALGAHKHGEAELLLVVDEQLLNVTLIIPAVDLLGFEHAPKNEQEQQRLNSLVANLRQAEKQLGIPAAAQCSLLDATVDSALLSVTNNNHSDFSIEYYYQCAQPQQLVRIDLSPLLASYRSLTNLAVSWIVNDRQGASNITQARTKLRLD